MRDDGQVIARGEHARRLLEDAELRVIFEDLEAAIVKNWKSAPTVEAREAAHAELSGVLLFLRELRARVNAGEAAKERMQRASQTDEE